MNKQLQIERNRREIARLLESDLPIDIIDFRIRELSKENDYLINE